MIGGCDVLFQIPPDEEGLDEVLAAAAGVVQTHWPDARFENAFTGLKYARTERIPFNECQELLAYPDAAAELSWDEGQVDSPENSMMHLLVAPGCLTVVVDNPDAPQMASILSSIREAVATLPNHRPQETVP